MQALSILILLPAPDLLNNVPVFATSGQLIFPPSSYSIFIVNIKSAFTLLEEVNDVNLLI